ncbi:MAG: ABC transporter permease [Trueperaceae bacterium]|nr:MAG: ABC transporter permease [Trueperaceae bacterium]
MTRTNPDVTEGAPTRQETGKSLFSIAWKQFLKHPLARASLFILGFLYLLAAFADFFAPYPENFLNAYATFQPPNKIRYRDQDNRWVGPYIYQMTKSIDMQTFEEIWTVDESRRYPIKFFVRREGVRERYVPFPVNLIPIGLRHKLGIKPWATLHLFGVDDPSDRTKLYLWGSDDVGSDVFSKILFGARVSLTIGIVAALVSIAIGMIMGGIAGYFGGWIDELIMRFVEVLAAIPDLFLLIALSATFYPLNLPSSALFTLIVIVLSTVGWGGIARTVRGQVLSLKERDFTAAAKAIGSSNGRIIVRHLLPNTLSYVIVVLSLIVPSFILVESVLSFFGLGIQPPATSWGLMLSTAQAFAGVTGLTERWWIYTPGIFIFTSVLTWNLLGDGLRDAFDPRSRQ